MGLSQLYPDFKPTLVLNFARAKQLDSRVTFQRGTIATRMNEQGLVETVGVGIPRFDHFYDSSTRTTTCKGLLVEETKTNLLAWSEDFSRNSWTTSNATVGVATSTRPFPPNGIGNTSFILIEDAGITATHFISTTVSVANTTIYSFSCFAKSIASGTNRALHLSGIGSPFTTTPEMFVNLDTGVGITTLYQGITTSYIQAYANGWYRVGWAATSSTAGIATFRIGIVSTSDSGLIATYSGSGSSIAIWGSQLENSAKPTSYIKTSTSSGIRSGDLAFINMETLPSWFNPVEGTLIFEHTAVGFNSTHSNSFPAIGFAQTNGFPTNAIQYFITLQNSTSQFLIRTNNVDQLTINSPTPIGREHPERSVGISYTTNSGVLAVNGSIIGVTSFLNLPTSIGVLIIGNATKSIANSLNGCIPYIRYYPKFLDNVYLQNLTKK